MTRHSRTVLYISLLANLLLLGVVFGHCGRDWLSTPIARKTPEEIEAGLSADQRSEFHAVLQESQARLAPLRGQIDAKRSKALCLLAAEPFDAKAYLANASELHELHGRMAQALSAIMAEHAAAFSPQERVAMIDLLRPAPQRMPKDPCANKAK